MMAKLTFPGRYLTHMLLLLLATDTRMIGCVECFWSFFFLSSAHSPLRSSWLNILLGFLLYSAHFGFPTSINTLQSSFPTVPFICASDRIGHFTQGRSKTVHEVEYDTQPSTKALWRCSNQLLWAAFPGALCSRQPKREGSREVDCFTRFILQPFRFAGSSSCFICILR